MTSPFDHTHDLDLGVSRSESEIALSQEWGSLLTMNEKDASHPFMTMILTCVTMVGWADVPDSDRGDFRRRPAVDISSLIFGSSISCINKQKRNRRFIARLQQLHCNTHWGYCILVQTHRKGIRHIQLQVLFGPYHVVLVCLR